MGVASMGWMALGMEPETAPSRSLTAEDAGCAEFFGGGSFECDLDFFPDFADCVLLVLFWSFSAILASSAVTAFFSSARAIASANQAAFTLPLPAGRLLVHSFDFASPPISSMV